jgi:hypothetical protein
MEGVANASLPPVKCSQIEDTWYLKGEKKALLTKQRKRWSALSSKLGQSGHVFVCLFFQAVEFSLCQACSIFGKSYPREYFVKVYEVQVMVAC